MRTRRLKACCKCGTVIPSPHLASNEPERCDQCADPGETIRERPVVVGPIVFVHVGDKR